ncbi:MAG: FtsQ-type POTRA domain-containing protein [Streptococcaceae bacterium]|jgi:cell division protein FtsQ|nr:FtsQ-type POTRA domain-containing protein [Streptococcaceae bacterium]
MAEEIKSPWQIEHEKMLDQQEAKKKAQAKKKRLEFLRSLKITRKSDQSLHEIAEAEEKNDEETEASSTAADEVNQTALSYKDGEVIDNRFDNAEDQSTMPSSLKSFTRILRRIWPILLVFFIVFAGSIYYLSPLNRIGSFKISGNSVVKASDIAASSKLTMQSSISGIFRHKAAIEAKISKSSPRIESTQISVSLPNKVNISVKEYENIGYVEQKGKDYVILANGTIISETVVPKEKIPATSLLLKDFNEKQTKQFAENFDALDQSLKGMIRTVTMTPSQATDDFITLQMADGNQVKVPLSQMKQKLPWYPSIAKQVAPPTTVDMEVVEAGIFTAPTPQYDAEFADNNPAGLSKSLSESKAAAGTASGSSSSGGESSSSTTASVSQ